MQYASIYSTVVMLLMYTLVFFFEWGRELEMWGQFRDRDNISIKANGIRTGHPKLFGS